MKCSFCGKDIIQPVGKRKKEFCNNTCRSNNWYSIHKNDKKKEKSTKSIVNKPIVRDLNKESEPVGASKWKIKERPQPPQGLTGLALRIWKDNHK